MERLKKIIDSIKNIWNFKNKNKIVENSVIVIIIGIIIVIAGGSLFGKSDDKSQKQTADESTGAVEVSKTVTTDYMTELEKSIESILSQIEGAGKVNVLITYASGKEMVPAVDTKKTENDTGEKDTGGGTRDIKESDYESSVVYEELQGGGKKPLIAKELLPTVKGVVVVADGASDPVVKESLCEAVQVLMDVPLHKIQVFSRNK